MSPARTTGAQAFLRPVAAYLRRPARPSHREGVNYSDHPLHIVGSPRTAALCGRHDVRVTDAVLSPDGRYGYLLTRRWAEGPVATFVMLNPSTADAAQDDPTIRRCIAFAKRENCGGLAVVNLFAYRATKPSELSQVVDPVGPENDSWPRTTLSGNGLVIAAWGMHGPGDLAEAVVRLAGDRLRALGVTKDGRPRHPLYVRGDAPLVPWPVAP